MQEHIIQCDGLTAEQILHYQSNPDTSELTCLVLPNDANYHSLLQEHGFRYIGRREVDGVVKIVCRWYRGLTEDIEDMASFFNRRVQDYDYHMRGYNFYELALANVAAHVRPSDEGIVVLDLGCGTGAELEYVFEKAPNAHAVCIDLSSGMLEKLLEKYPKQRVNIETICGSYLGMDFGTEQYDYVMACNTLHHILKEDKAVLYKAIQRSLKKDGLLLIADYVVKPEEEAQYREKYLSMVGSGTLDRNSVYHLDLTLSYDSERQLLTDAGFRLIRAERDGENSVEFVAGV